MKLIGTGLCLLLLLCSNLAAQTVGAQKFAHSRTGMAATGSTYATTAAVQMLEAGGNAMDAAAAAWFALCVTDPANASLGGRAQILLRLRNGEIVVLDGATAAPVGVPALRDAKDERAGYALVPVPGGLAAVAAMQRRYGKLKFAEVLQPALLLAEKGFSVPPRLAATWRQARAALARNPGAAQNFLKPDGAAWQEGETFCQPRLTRVLRQIAAGGIAVFYRGELAAAMARDVAAHGGFLRQSDLLNYRVQPGVAVRANEIIF